jgi:3-isopropylmalate/(R)-2-methylmalate dehydratase small subunit
MQERQGPSARLRVSHLGVVPFRTGFEFKGKPNLMEPITKFTGRVVPLNAKDVDTDQIIPARFLKTIDKQGLGKDLFCDWRYHADGSPKPDFILNQPRAQGASVLLAGDNFGCGSSREHAPWALLGFGFRAVISSSFADIFRNNSLKNGLLPVMVDPATLSELFAIAGRDESFEATVDLPRQTLRLPNGREVEFPIDSFSKKCLMAGVDQLGYLQAQDATIQAFEKSHPQTIATL